MNHGLPFSELSNNDLNRLFSNNTYHQYPQHVIVWWTLQSIMQYITSNSNPFEVINSHELTCSYMICDDLNINNYDYASSQKFLALNINSLPVH